MKKIIIGVLLAVALTFGTSGLVDAAVRSRGISVVTVPMSSRTIV